MSDSSDSSSQSTSDDEQFYDAISDKEVVNNDVIEDKDNNQRMTESMTHMADRGLYSSQSSDVITSDVVSDLVTDSVPDVVPKINTQSIAINSTTRSFGSVACDPVINMSVINENEDMSSSTTQSSQPRPPPRVKKKKTNNNINNGSVDEMSSTSSAKNVGFSSNSYLASNQLTDSQNVSSDLPNFQYPMNLVNNSNLSSLLDDIASIKGDLSLNEAILSQIGDRRSVYVDECSKQNKELMFRSEELLPSMAQITQTLNEPREQEILNQIMILNIDTGEKVPLSKAEEILPKCLNPLSLHLMKLTNDFLDGDVSSITSDMTAHENMMRAHAFDDEDDDERSGESKKEKLKKGMKNLKKFGTGIMKGVKGVKTSKERSTFHVELKTHNVEPEPQPRFKIKVNHKRGTPDFEGLKLLQELYDCKGAIWCMKFSVCGQLLAAAGQDHLLRVYCAQKSWKYFTQLRNKASGQQISPNSTKERDNGSFGNRSFSLQRSGSLSSSDNLKLESSSSLANHILYEDNTLSEEGPMLLFSAYRGHTADVLDIAWSKNHFLLSSSMDKTVRLWHITRIECLCTFRHIDFVTTIQFHPRDDRYFLSGSLDGKLRLWNIPDKRVTLWNEVMALPTQQSRSNATQESVPAHGLITSSSFVQNGKFAVIGTYDGRIIFYSTDQLKYFTQIHVSGSGKNNSSTQTSSGNTGNDRRRRRNNNKVTGIESVDDNKILVTTNDSRLRLYDLRDLSLTCKYRGVLNQSSQIKASTSHDSKYIICGSENASFYIWRLQDNTTIGQRRDRNKQYECVRLLPPQPTHTTPESLQAPPPSMMTTKIVTSAIFAPVPQQIDETAKYIIAVADFNGNIRIFCK